MKKLHILALAVAAALASTMAIAQTAAPKAPPKIDANGDGVISKTEAAAYPRLAAKFDRLDTNKDGKLSADERPAPGRGFGRDGRHGGPGGPLRALDTDNDGRISKVEAQAGKGDFAARFASMDINKDGYVDRADMELRGKQERAAFFAGADANKDGKLSRDEFTVEQGARASERREKFQQFAQARGKQATARSAPTEAEQIQHAGKAFDRMDANKDGFVSKAEFDASKPMQGHGRGHGHGRVMGPRPPKA